MFDDLHDPSPPTPNSRHFAAVATRARQMRMRRWAVSTTAALVVFVMGVGVVVARDNDPAIQTDQTTTTAPSTTVPSSTSTTEPTSPTTSTPTGPRRPIECPALPDGLALTGGVGNQIVSITRDGATSLAKVGDGPINHSLRGADGTVWIQTGDIGRNVEIRRITPNGDVTVSAAGAFRLSHVGEVDGRSAVTYIEQPYATYQEGEHGVLWLEYSDGERTPIADLPAFGTGLGSAIPSADLIALSLVGDLDAEFRYVNSNGDEITDVFDPTDRGPDQTSGMIAKSVSIAPDRATVAWVEVVGFGDMQEQWSLVVADAADGTERLRLTLTEKRTGAGIWHADYDGRWWVGTLDTTDNTGRPLNRVVVVDTQAANPRAIDIGCKPEMAMVGIDRGVQPLVPPTTTTPPTTAPVNMAAIECPALPDGLALTAAVGNEGWSVANAGAELLYSAENETIGVGRVLRGQDGTVWVADGEGTMSRIRRITPDGEISESESTNSEADGGLVLSHVGTIDGQTAATYINSYNPDSTEQFGDIWLEYSDGERTSLGNAGDPTSVAMSAAPNDAAIAVGATADLGEAFQYLTPNGTEIELWYDPSDDSSLYNMPPWFESPMVSPDAGRLAWVEGPDDRGDAPDTLVGEWELVVAQTGSSDELLRVQVGTNAETLLAADYDGRYWVGTFGDREGRAVRPPAADATRVVVVDTLAADSRPIDVGCTPPTNIAIDRAATQSSTPPTNPRRKTVTDDTGTLSIDVPVSWSVDRTSLGGYVGFLDEFQGNWPTIGLDLNGVIDDDPLGSMIVQAIPRRAQERDDFSGDLGIDCPESGSEAFNNGSISGTRSILTCPDRSARHQVLGSDGDTSVFVELWVDDPEQTESFDAALDSLRINRPLPPSNMECGVVGDAPAIRDNIDEVPPPQQLADDARWEFTGTTNYDPCAALSYARLDITGGTGSSPVQLMLFHDGEYVGTASECAFGSTSVIDIAADSITVEYRWPREGDANADPSGRATVTYRWAGGMVRADRELPAELLRVNDCQG